MFFWSLLGKHQKTGFSTFFGPKPNFFPVNLNFLLFDHLAQSIGRLSREFQQHRSLTVKLRSVLMQTGRTQKTIFFRFFGSKRNFFLLKLPFLLFEHFARCVGRLCGKFEQHRTLTANLRSLFLELSATVTDKVIERNQPLEDHH